MSRYIRVLVLALALALAAVVNAQEFTAAIDDIPLAQQAPFVFVGTVKAVTPAPRSGETFNGLATMHIDRILKMAPALKFAAGQDFQAHYCANQLTVFTQNEVMTLVPGQQSIFFITYSDWGGFRAVLGSHIGTKPVAEEAKFQNIIRGLPSSASVGIPSFLNRAGNADNVATVKLKTTRLGEADAQGNRPILMDLDVVDNKSGDDLPATVTINLGKMPAGQKLPDMSSMYQPGVTYTSYLRKTGDGYVPILSLSGTALLPAEQADIAVRSLQLQPMKVKLTSNVSLLAFNKANEMIFEIKNTAGEAVQINSFVLDAKYLSPLLKDTKVQIKGVISPAKPGESGLPLVVPANATVNVKVLCEVPAPAELALFGPDSYLCMPIQVKLRLSSRRPNTSVVDLTVPTLSCSVDLGRMLVGYPVPDPKPAKDAGAPADNKLADKLAGK
ncbi:MAG: hypothetical protein WCJ56_12575 [bacterium]